MNKDDSKTPIFIEFHQSEKITPKQQRLANRWHLICKETTTPDIYQCQKFEDFSNAIEHYNQIQDTKTHKLVSTPELKQNQNPIKINRQDAFFFN